ncbi:MAG: VCBS repeat-containing protein [Saprospiraceae bacterium]|nr:VCBS repeat-containing protein [Saprospiraceae bacterium]
MKRFLIPLLPFLIIGCSPDNIVGDKPIAKPIFQKVDNAESGIHFSNTIQENVETRENVFDYDYFYNGAGVGIADINNDGLNDIFFCGNQVSNRLYLNKGNLQFEDITESSKIDVTGGWSNGVAVADVNNDGWLDFYISQGGPFEPAKRKNLLFINQHDLTFKESAEHYGLADNSISTHAAFFDFDKDEDLDCVVMNENSLYGYGPSELNKLLAEDKDLLHMSSSHLYRNDNGRFLDVTENAGLLYPSFGLGLVISDINGDNWLDIYIANDYYLPDAIYLNQKDGTFLENIDALTSQISFAGMGVDIADINNDSYREICVLDMASTDHFRSKTLMASMDTRSFDMLVNQMGYHHQYMFNSLQLNNGNNTFKNIAHFLGLAKTDWSWAVLMVDFNNDTNKDILVTNGYRRYSTDNDVRMAITLAKQVFNNEVPLDVKERIYYSMPTEKLPNIIFENEGNLNFSDKSKQWGIEDSSFSNGAVYSDLDNDGDLELVINNMDEEAFLYKNMSVENGAGNYLNVKTVGELSESFPEITLVAKGKKQVIESKRVRGYRSSVDNLAHFGLGDAKEVDTIRVEWPSGKTEEKYSLKANRVILFEENNASIAAAKNDGKRRPTFERVSAAALGLEFKHQENDYNDFEKEILLPYRQSTLGPYMSKGDVNADGIDDLYVGGASGQSGQILICDGATFKPLRNRDFELDAFYEDMESIFFDFDGDGDLDLYVVSGGNEFPPDSERYRDRLYVNNGRGTFKKSVDKSFDGYTHSGKAVCVLDYDNDNDLDLIVGNRIIPQHYPKAAPSYIYKNDNGQFKDVTEEVIPELKSFGIINKVLRTDFDADGWKDLVIIGEWTRIGLFKNNRGSFKDISADNNLNQEFGWWFTVKETDINKDGLPDFVLGNLGLNTKYKATSDKPLKVFASDFDGNTTFDIVLSTEYRGDYVPFRGKECSTEQMPFISEKFATFESFANASLIDIFGDELSDSYQREASTFESILLLNLGEGKFERIALPVEAQFFPILDIETHDVNKDGYEDLLLVGGMYNTEAETPRFDAGSGLVLISNRKNGYSTEQIFNSEFYINGNTKSMELIKDREGNDYVVIGTNNDSLSVFRIH